MGLIRALEAWDILRARPRYRLWGLVVSAGLAAAVYASARNIVSHEAAGAASMTTLMAAWWLGGVMPMAVTAAVPLVMMPALGLGAVAEVAALYADPLNVLMLGGFLLAFAMEEVDLHARVVRALLAPAWVRASPRRMAFALMVAAACVSAFINNTATMLMMLPTAMLLAKACGDAPRVRSAFVLVTAYACSIGGVGTLVGTAPNAVLAGLAPRVAGVQLGFVTWMAIGVPFVLLALPVAWWVVTHVALPLPSTVETPPERPRQHPWSRSERIVAIAMTSCLTLWLTRSRLDAGDLHWAGWGSWFPSKVDDGYVAIAVVLGLFMLPGERKSSVDRQVVAARHGDDAGEDAFLLSWRRASRAVPWSVLVLMGGGFAMAEAVTTSGLSAALADAIASLGALPPALQVFAISAGIAFLSAFTSNTATTQLALPLLGAGAVAAGVPPLLWMVPAAIAASCDFALAVGTPPNAIAAEAGGVRAADMAYAGVLLNVLCAGVTTLVVLVIGRVVLVH